MTPYPPQYPQGQPAPPPPPPPPAYAPQPAAPMGYYQQPMAYYPPPMVMAPVMLPPPGQKTFEGLKWLKNAAIGAMVYNAMFIIGGLVAATALSSFNATNPNQLASVLGMIVLIGVLFVIGGIIGLITFIFALMGYYNTHEGRREFGEEHRVSVEGSVKWFVIACVMYLASVIAGIFLAFSAIGNPTPQAIAASYATSAAVSGGLTLVYIYAAAMVMQEILAKLMTADGRRYRQMFILLSLIGGGLALALNVAAGFMFTNALANANAVSGVTSFASLAAILTIVTSFLYLKQVKSAEQGARNMIASGQFNPDAGTPAAAPAPTPGPVV